MAPPFFFMRFFVLHPFCILQIITFLGRFVYSCQEYFYFFQKYFNFLPGILLFFCREFFYFCQE